MTGYPYFAFIDESGTLAHDEDQRFFSIGLLLIEDTSRITQELSLIRNQAIAGLNAKGKGFEFKFNRITNRSRPFYELLIDTVLSHPVRICVLALDKTNPEIDYESRFKFTWDAYIYFVKHILKHNVKPEKPCIVLADYIHKPKKCSHYLETELKLLPQVDNATMLESESANLIQLIDLLVGCVTFQFRRRENSSRSVNESKAAVSDYLMNKLDIATLAQDFSVQKPVFFEVWEYKLQK